MSSQTSSAALSSKKDKTMMYVLIALIGIVILMILFSCSGSTTEQTESRYFDDQLYGSSSSCSSCGCYEGIAYAADKKKNGEVERFDSKKYDECIKCLDTYKTPSVRTAQCWMCPECTDFSTGIAPKSCPKEGFRRERFSNNYNHPNDIYVEKRASPSNPFYGHLQNYNDVIEPPSQIATASPIVSSDTILP